MDRDLIVDQRIRIPREELKLTFVRSSGPGGQNVNKVNTKAVLRWHVAASQSLPEDVRARLLAAYRRRISASGQLVLTSQRYREQQRNLVDCLNKLRAMVAAVATPRKRRRPTRCSRAATERRLKEKRQMAAKKQDRRGRSWLDS